MANSYPYFAEVCRLPRYQVEELRKANPDSYVDCVTGSITKYNLQKSVPVVEQPEPMTAAEAQKEASHETMSIVIVLVMSLAVILGLLTKRKSDPSQEVGVWPSTNPSSLIRTKGSQCYDN